MRLIVNLRGRLDDETAQMYLSLQQQSMAEHRSQFDKKTVVQKLSQSCWRIQERGSNRNGAKLLSKRECHRLSVT